MTGEALDARAVPAPPWLAAPAARAPFAVVLTGPGLARGVPASLAAPLTALAPHIEAHRCAPLHVEYQLDIGREEAWELFATLLAAAPAAGVDCAVVPAAWRSVRVLVCDMDSTIVASETLDDLAARAGCGPEVAAITAQAMRGDLDFEDALRARVRLLRGLPAQLLDDVAATVDLTPGAAELLARARAAGLRTLLVSGGFDAVVGPVATRLGFDGHVCNRLEVSAGMLTGEVVDPVHGAQAKRAALVGECRALGVPATASCAVGDGANDIPMLSAAGLGVAFRAKPAVRAATPYRIDHGGLEAVAALLGLPA